jgi:4-hydroxy-tetrahydrodipicolinate synthase
MARGLAKSRASIEIFTSHHFSRPENCMTDSTPKFHGIIPPVVTPLTSSGELDMQGLEKLIEHQIAGGVHGLFMLGTTGEAPSLSHDLQRQVIESSSRIVAARVPVLIGISNTSLAESVAMARCAADAGCDAVVAAAPYYLPIDQTELAGYFRQLSQQVPLPLVLYNFPLLTKVVFEPETIRQLLDEPNIVGIKDSSGDLDYFAKIVEVAKSRPGFSLLAGREASLHKIVSLGGDGGVTGGANIYPRLFVDFYNAAVAKAADKIAECSELVNTLGQIYAVPGNRFSAGIAGTKAALELLDICRGDVAPPIQQVTDEQKAKIKSILESLKLL